MRTKRKLKVGCRSAVVYTGNNNVSVPTNTTTTSYNGYNATPYYSNGSNISAPAANGVFTINQTGLYLVCGNFLVGTIGNATNGNYRQMDLYKVGAGVLGYMFTGSNGGSFWF